MDKRSEDFLGSLDLTDEAMEEHIPYVLQDLWELGSIPDYIVRLIKSNVNTHEIDKITDFGCGKGAVLINLAKQLDFNGTGIDIVPEFIDSAIQYARKEAVSHKLNFITGDLKEYVAKITDCNVVIYGYDSEILGNIYESLIRLKNCLRDPEGNIIEIQHWCKE